MQCGILEMDTNDKRKMGKWGHCHHPQYRHPEIQFPMTDIISPPSPPFDRPVCCFLFDLPSHQLSPVASASPAPSATKQSTRAGQHGNYLQKLSLHRSKERGRNCQNCSNSHLSQNSQPTWPLPVTILNLRQWLPYKLKFPDDEAKAMLHDICAGASNTHPREKSPCLCSSPTAFTTLKEAPCQPEKSLTSETVIQYLW